jgi:hypothetical protein
LAALAELLGKIRFFQERGINSRGFELIEIAKALVLEVLPAAHRVCEYGEGGDKFYIILRGKVKVEIPQEVMVPQKELEESQSRLRKTGEIIEV